MRALSYLILASLPLLFGVAVHATGLGSPTIAAQQNAASSRPVTRAAAEVQSSAQAPGPQTEATLSERLADAERRALILEARSHIEGRAYNQFSLIMSGLGVVITFLVLGFGFITHRNAVIAARQEIFDLKDKVLALHDEAAAATAAGRAAAEDAKLAASDARKHEQDLKLSSEKLLKDAVALAERVKLTSEGVKAELSVEERKTVADAAKDVAAKPENEWTADEFTVNILKAEAEERWEEMLRLAKGMEFIHSRYPESLVYALFQQASALRNLSRPDEEVVVLNELGSRLSGTDNPDVNTLLVVGLVNRAITLVALGRDEEALAASDDAINRIVAINDDRLQTQLAKAIVNRGVSLGRLGRWDEELSAYGDAIDRFGPAQDRALSEEVALAYLNRACVLARQGKVSASIAELELWSARSGTFDCQQIANEADFNAIREKPAFVRYLRKQGCAA